MLVIARKPHEAVVIGEHIRVEVLKLTGGVARLRCVSPKSAVVTRGVAKPGDSAAIETVNGGVDASGNGVVDLMLARDQIIAIGAEIHLGLIDIDATRAVLFVDAPIGLAVKVEGTIKSRPHHDPKPGGDEAVQAFLPFSRALGPESERESSRAPHADSNGTRESPSVRTLPFPGLRDDEGRAEP